MLLLIVVALLQKYCNFILYFHHILEAEITSVVSAAFPMSSVWCVRGEGVSLVSWALWMTVSSGYVCAPISIEGPLSGVYIVRGYPGETWACMFCSAGICPGHS